ncbi:hypothetical protein [Nonomuraea dietziae]|uniref:hypothetical protein n=1 Tax=Nonomuraea dietziae TaxID=65515 RepID=UPI003CD05C75
MDLWIVDRGEARSISMSRWAGCLGQLLRALLAHHLGIILCATQRRDHAGQFFAATCTEYSLSVDNLIHLLHHHGTLRRSEVYQHRVLLVGI